MTSFETSSRELRRKRTRSLIQLAGLLNKAGLLETCGISLGTDLQKNPEMQKPVAALYKGFLVLNEMAQSENVLPLWTMKGLEALGNLKKEKLQSA